MTARKDRALRADGQITRTRILEAAGARFAETGYANTTSKEIASDAGVDVASINYHFASRENLYKSVVIEAHHRLISRETLQQLADSDCAPDQKLKRIIELLVQAAFQDQGWHLKLLTRELLSPSLGIEVLQQNEILPKLPLVSAIFSEITSIPQDDPALLRCMISALAPCTVLLVAGQSLAPVSDAISTGTPDSLVSHLHRFALGGLEAIVRDHKPPI